MRLSSFMLQLLWPLARMRGLGLAQMLKSGAAVETSLGRFTFDTKGDGQDLRFSWFSWNNGVYQTIAAESQ